MTWGSPHAGRAGKAGSSVPGTTRCACAATPPARNPDVARRGTRQGPASPYRKGPSGGLRRRGGAGFTLFELVIVLTIAAFLLAFVLQGSSLRKEAYLKDLVSTVKDLSEATRQFRERYHYLPGDLRRALDDLPMSAAEQAACGMAGGSFAGDGLIRNVADPEQGYVESACAPLHLARAGLIRGDTSPITRQFGEAQVTVTFMARQDARVSTPPYPTVVQNVLEMEGVPYALAVRLDEILDDGDPQTGKVQACDAAGNVVIPPQNRIPPEDPDNVVVPFLAVPLL